MKVRTPQRLDRWLTFHISTAPISKRSTIGVLRTDHEGDIDGVAAESDSSLAFTSTTCTVLNPEGEVGPFYVLGEYVTADLIQDEEGVEVVADIQFIDVSTCEPLVGVCECLAEILSMFTGCVRGFVFADLPCPLFEY